MFLYNLPTSASEVGNFQLFFYKNDSSDNSSDNIYRTIVLMPKLYDPQKTRRQRIYQKKTDAKCCNSHKMCKFAYVFN